MSVKIQRQWLSVLAAGIILIAYGGVSTAQSPDPAYGTWKLNVAKSKFSPGPAPKELTVTIEADGAGRKVSVKGVDGEGKPVAWGYSGAFDGKDVRVTGSNPDADVVTLKRISANATRTQYKLATKRTTANGLSVSTDGKTLTVATTGVNAKGQTVKNSQVFDKQ